MDTGTTQRTNLRVIRGVFFMIIGVTLAVTIILLVVNLREKVVADFEQSVSSIGTKFEVVENAYEDAKKVLLSRKPLSEETLNSLTSSYRDLKSDFTELKDNIFIAKEEGNSIDETIILIDIRLEQIKSIEVGSFFIENEITLQSELKTFDECINKVNYKDSADKIPQLIRICSDSLAAAQNTSITIEKTEKFVCEQENVPSRYVQKAKDTYELLAKYYEAISLKDYVETEKKDREFKSSRDQLNAMKPVTYCVTKTLEDIGKRLE